MILMNRLYSTLKALFLVCLVAQMLACATTAKTPIESRTQPPSRKIDTHIVEKGDTLYSIAWRYEKHYKQLASLNGITPPYTIFVGQNIKLSGHPVRIKASRVSTSQTVSAAEHVSRPQPGSNTTTSSAASRAVSASKPPAKVPGLPASVQGWNWPLNGKIVRTFGSNDLTKGITLDSSSNKEVRAAAEGVVVYSGSGVRGYGNFLILKHSDLFLSAYAYNSELLASEGDQIRQGQKIAVAGKDQDGQPRLYFEIRKNGKPVDPVRYLPKR